MTPAQQLRKISFNASLQVRGVNVTHSAGGFAGIVSTEPPAMVGFESAPNPETSAVITAFRSPESEAVTEGAALEADGTVWRVVKVENNPASLFVTFRVVLENEE